MYWFRERGTRRIQTELFENVCEYKKRNLYTRTALLVHFTGS